MIDSTRERPVSANDFKLKDWASHTMAPFQANVINQVLVVVVVG